MRCTNTKAKEDLEILELERELELWLPSKSRAEYRPMMVFAALD